MEAKISFIPIYSKDGTIYQKVIRISQEIFKAFNEALNVEINQGNTDYTRRFWMAQEVTKSVNGVIVFLNCTLVYL